MCELSARSIEEVDGAATEARERSLADGDGPAAGGAEANRIGHDELAMNAVADRIYLINESIETRD